MSGKAADNVVLIGKKDIMSYVLAVVTQFNNGEDTIIVKARGKAISRAVDVVEIVKRRFVQNVSTQSIIIGTEEVQGEEGPIKVSSMEITIARE
jgi:DNA-binding protein